MKDSNVVKDKSYSFALRIIKLYRYLTEKKKEFVISKQLLKCGTSIGTNVEEGIGAQSRRNFLSKFSIAYKEARETQYWIRLLSDSGCLTKKMTLSLLEDCNELLRILVSIQNTIKRSI